MGLCILTGGTEQWLLALLGDELLIRKICGNKELAFAILCKTRHIEQPNRLVQVVRLGCPFSQ